jgi:hypothetical protein
VLERGVKVAADGADGELGLHDWTSGQSGDYTLPLHGTRRGNPQPEEVSSVADAVQIFC